MSDITNGIIYWFLSNDDIALLQQQIALAPAAYQQYLTTLLTDFTLVSDRPGYTEEDGKFAPLSNISEFEMNWLSNNPAFSSFESVLFTLSTQPYEIGG